MQNQDKSRATTEIRPERLNRPLPTWYGEARLGILIHWGPYSVPAWAPAASAPGPQSGDWSAWFAANPYSEWYRNSIRIAGSPSQEHHSATYGEEFPYERFAAQFNEAVQDWDPAPWAELFQEIGARYVVLVTKHHDGFLLWPSAQPTPHQEGYFCPRDLVGELTTAVRARGIKMGLYYSGGLDWTFHPHVIRDVAGLLEGIPQTPEYARYVDAHWRELIDRYQPAILWNDIAYPATADVRDLLAYYYNCVPDGVVNDRFQQFPRRARLERLLAQPALRRILSGRIARMLDRQYSSPSAALSRRRRGEHFDFLTPEYKSWPNPPRFPWEHVRGLGHSFGYNRDEGSGVMLTVPALVHLLVDVASKGGNLLLGVGPAADGTIPEAQVERLRGLGHWLAVNGEAIFGTRPWVRAAGRSGEGLPLRFTRSQDSLFIILLECPQDRRVTVDVDCPMMSAYLLGDPMVLSWEVSARGIHITLPEDLPEAPAYTIRLRLLPGTR